MNFSEFRAIYTLLNSFKIMTQATLRARFPNIAKTSFYKVTKVSDKPVIEEKTKIRS